MKSILDLSNKLGCNATNWNPILFPTSLPTRLNNVVHGRDQRFGKATF